MRTYLGNRLVHVWAFLTAITIASWLIGRGHGVAYQVNLGVTVSVLVIAAIKALLVFQFFMEVRLGPAWLKRTAYGWVIGLLSVLLITYWRVHWLTKAGADAQTVIRDAPAYVLVQPGEALCSTIK